jgi:hypothetical protein
MIEKKQSEFEGTERKAYQQEMHKKLKAIIN